VNVNEQNYLSSYSDRNDLRDNGNKRNLSGRATKMISVTTTTNITAKMILMTITTNIILVVTANRNDLRDHNYQHYLSDLSNRNYRSDRSHQMI